LVISLLVYSYGYLVIGFSLLVLWFTLWNPEGSEAIPQGELLCLNVINRATTLPPEPRSGGMNILLKGEDN